MLNNCGAGEQGHFIERGATTELSGEPSDVLRGDGQGYSTVDARGRR